MTRRPDERFDPTNPDHIQVHGVTEPRRDSRRSRPPAPKVSRGRRALYLLAAAGLALGGGKLVYDNAKESAIDPVEQQNNTGEQPNNIEIEDIRPGTLLRVLRNPVQFDATQVNIRTSPQRIEGTDGESNKVNTPDIGSQNITILGGSIVPGEDANGDYICFVDEDGQKFYVNIAALVDNGVEVQVDGDNTETVVVTRTTDLGIFAQTEDGQEKTVATAVGL